VRWFKFFHPRPSRTNSQATLPSWPGSALRHREVTECPEAADSVNARTHLKKTALIDGYCPDDPHYRFGTAKNVFMFGYVRLVTQTVPLERSRGENGEDD